jgi:hypothetical protein
MATKTTKAVKAEKTTKEFTIKQLCKLPNGRKVFTGDFVTNTHTGKQLEVTGIRTDDGDKYLTFTDGSEALAVPGSDFWKTYSGGAHIHLK